MDTWHFDSVIECLPLMLQAALLGYALPNYLYFIDGVVASVVLGFTSFGLFFYTTPLPFPPLLLPMTVHSTGSICSSVPPIGTSPFCTGLS